MTSFGVAAAVASALVAQMALGASVGQPAPEFTALDTQGREHRLADFKGKTVVLEWTNDGCPFVKKHYSSGNMQNLQKEATAQGVVWLTVISSAPGEQGNRPPAELDELTARREAAPSAVLLDAAGTMGKAYAAQTTPHMYVIDKDGRLVYAGAIDSNPSADPRDIAGAQNYVKAALGEVLAGQPVTTAKTKPYGCSVKYQS
jgi:peroxiredoxin